MLNKMLSAALLVLTVSCTPPRVWSVREAIDGGTLAYQKGTTPKAEEQLPEMIDREAARVCGKRGWTKTEDQLRSKDSVYSYTTSQRIKTGETTTTVGAHSWKTDQYTTIDTPNVGTQTVYWRELSFSCGLEPKEATPIQPKLGEEKASVAGDLSVRCERKGGRLLNDQCVLSLDEEPSRPSVP